MPPGTDCKVAEDCFCIEGHACDVGASPHRFSARLPEAQIVLDRAHAGTERATTAASKLRAPVRAVPVSRMIPFLTSWPTSLKSLRAALTFDREVADDCGPGKTTVIKKLSVLILAATLLAGCFDFESPPQTTQQTTTTTTSTCPPGAQLQSDGMCR